MTAIELYEKLKEEKNYLNDDIGEALADETFMSDEEKEVHTLCCLELDRIQIFKLLIGEDKVVSPDDPTDIIPVWLHAYDEAHKLFRDGKIDYSIQYLLDLEKENNNA